MVYHFFQILMQLTSTIITPTLRSDPGPDVQHVETFYHPKLPQLVKLGKILWSSKSIESGPECQRSLCWKAGEIPWSKFVVKIYLSQITMSKSFLKTDLTFFERSLAFKINKLAEKILKESIFNILFYFSSSDSLPFLNSL